MRSALTLAVPVTGLLAVLGGCHGHFDCPAGCTEAVFATFHLSCSPNDLTSVATTGPCSTPDASLSWYTGSATEWDVAVASPTPGDCHIELTFATGFTYSADVTFTSQTNEPSCGCPSFIAPTSGPFTVDNPSDTCVDAGLDAEGDGSADAATCPSTASDSVSCASPGSCTGCRDNVRFGCTCAAADAADADGSGLQWQCLDTGMPCSP